MIKSAKKSSHQANLINHGSDNMKQGWEKKKLGDICEFVRGPFGGSLKKNIFMPVGFAVYEQQHAIYDQFDDIRYFIDENKFNEMKRFELKAGDLIMSCSGTMGKVAIVPNEFKKGIINQALLKISPSNKISNVFLKLWMQSESFQESLKIYSGGAAIQNVASVAILKQIEIPLPPLPEQQRIVSLLEEAFAAIAKAKANAEQNLKNARELFESYLQGVFENGNWETKTIELVCDEIFAGGDAPKNNFSLEPNEKHTIPIYANAVKDKGLYGYTDFARVTKPCVTIAARGSGTGHTELRREHFLPIVRLIVCIPDTKQISTEFLKYTIDNLVIQRSGSAIPQLTVPMIKDYKIPVPNIEEQELIIEKAETLKQQKENLESVYLQKIADLEELKKSILQKAFSGGLNLDFKDSQITTIREKSRNNINQV